MSKQKVVLKEGETPDAKLQKLAEKYASEHPNTIDGVKIDFAREWVHVRKSNTEPIIRIYTEAPSQEEADKLANDFKHVLAEL